MSASDITIIAAMDQQGALGNNNQLVWHLPNDLAWFKNRTKNKTLIMGKNTALSLDNPLPHRLNVVLSRHTLPCELGDVKEIASIDPRFNKNPQNNTPSNDCEKHAWGNIAEDFDKIFFHATDFNQALLFCQKAILFIPDLEDEIMVVGGGQVYKEALEKEHATLADITYIEHTFPVVDTFFPKDLLKGFIILEEKSFPKDEKNPFSHKIVRYKRSPKTSV